jgi:hypothetical protein
MLAAGSFTLQGAIQKTQARIAEMESAAFQTRTRDRLYTVGVVAGVVVAGAGSRSGCCLVYDERVLALSRSADSPSRV